MHLSRTIPVYTVSSHMCRVLHKFQVVNAVVVMKCAFIGEVTIFDKWLNTDLICHYNCLHYNVS